MKKVLIFGGCILCIVCLGYLLLCVGGFLLIYVEGDSPHGWETIAVTTNAVGSYYFVRQKSEKGLDDIMFGYVDKSGVRYAYHVDHDAFPMKRVRLVEENGQIYMYQNNSEKVGSFDPDHGVFHNDIYSMTYGKKIGLERGLQDSFFDLSITNGP
jgi:hypothetical protein